MLEHFKREKLAAVTRTVIEVFLSLCLHCEKQKPQKTSKMVVTPMVKEQFAGRFQVDLVDFQANKDGDYKYMLNLINHCTKYCLL